MKSNIRTKFYLQQNIYHDTHNFHTHQDLVVLKYLQTILVIVTTFSLREISENSAWSALIPRQARRIIHRTTRNSSSTTPNSHNRAAR